MSAFIEVNEAAVFATRQGINWWTVFRLAFDTSGRIEDVTVSPGGNLCRVACEDRQTADWLAARMLAEGMPASAVRVKTVTAAGGVR